MAYETPMRRPPPTPIARLFRDGLRAAKLEHDGAAEALYVSARQIGRYVAGDTVPAQKKLLLLARAVAPHDGELASQLAKAGGAVLDAPNVPPAAPAAHPVTLDIHASRLVGDRRLRCRRLPSMRTPRTARAAVAAAFVSARDLGLSSDTVIAALVPPNAPVPPK